MVGNGIFQAKKTLLLTAAAIAFGVTPSHSAIAGKEQRK
jgi:hypothetical protein